MAEGRTAHLRLEHIVLDAGDTFTRSEPAREVVVVMLEGECTVTAGGEEHVLTRTGVFRDVASAVYVPPGVDLSVHTDGAARIAWCAGDATQSGGVALVRPEDVACRAVGRDTYERRVCDIIGEEFPAQHLVIGETFNKPGKWSSFPPHRHDQDRLPIEADMEEIYFFKVDPAEGFGLQRVYSPEAGFDTAHVLTDETVVEIPEGYHPVCAAPGCELYYLWVLWGEKRTLAPFDDPAMESVKMRLSEGADR